MKKLIGIAMAVVLTICLFAGCGGKDVQPEPTPSPTPAPTAVPTATPAPTPVPFETVVESQPASYRAAADSAGVYSALSAAWSAEGERILYGGDTVLTDVPEDAAVTLFRDTAPVYASVGAPVSDGTYLYMLSGTSLHILSADGVNSTPLAALEVGSGWSDTQEGQETTWGGFEKYPSHLFLTDGKLVILSNFYGYESYMEGSVNVCDYTEYTCVDVYDLTDPIAPVPVASFGQDGSCTAAELVEGVLYLVTEHEVYRDADPADAADYMPALYSADGLQVMDAASVFLPDEAAGSVYALTGAYDIANAVRLDVKAVLGANGDAVIAAPSVYLTARRYITGLSASYKDNIYDVSEYACVAATDVCRMELAGGILEMKNTGSVVGHPAGERSAAVLNGNLDLALREENFRYTLYVDTQHGFENILWGELESGDSVASLSSQLQPGGEENVPGMFRGYLFNWNDGSFIGLGRDESGVVKLSMLTVAADGTLQETAAKTFGSDYSETLSSSASLYANSENNIIGFAADDSYSFYCVTEEGEFASLFDAYITDWPWHVRCEVVGDHLYMTDRTTVYIYSLTDMALVHTVTL